MSRKSKGTRQHLCGDGLLELLRSDFEKVPDSRQAGKVEFVLPDVLMAGFSMFSLKKASLLQYISDMGEDGALPRNVRAIYGLTEIPSDTQMREILDPVDPQQIVPCFRHVFNQIQRGKGLERFQVLDGHYLLALDGTGYFSSSKVHCQNCQEKHHRDGRVTYSHAMLGAAIVSPKLKQVIPLAPEPIIKQDGQDKNDCERNAAKRFLVQFRKDHPHLNAIVVEDALSSNAPHIHDLRKAGLRFILGVKDPGNKFLFNWVNTEADKGNVTEFRQEEGDVTHRFRFINGVPLNESNLDVQVNFLEYWEEKDGETTKHFSWVTDLHVTKKNADEMMRCGRARWRIENETFNTLKNQGYHFEHNYGHGQENLSVNLALLVMLAFLVDQAQEICCRLFQAVLKKCERKMYMWKTIRRLLHVLLFDSWYHLLTAILRGIEPQRPKLCIDSS